MLRRMSVRKPLHKVMAFMIAILFTAIMGIGHGSTRADGRPAGGGGDGGNIIVFDIVDSVSASRVMVLDESTFPGVYEVLVDMGDSIEFGLMCDIEQPGPQRCPVFSVSIMF